MSTATLPAAGPMGERHRAFWRFAWKEYRMLRGFWLAVAALAVMIQVYGTLPISAGRAQIMFGIALGATVLYAAGAAATLFAVEHEEETYELLTTLPVEWLPVFLAKLLVAVASSAALGAVLVGSSFIQVGPWNRDTAYLLLPAVAESIAWGIFMSLTIRRPLVAAVATIAVVSVQVNVLMSFMSEFATPISDARNYPPTMPWRLAITAVVLLMDVALGREWLRATATKSESVWKRFGRSKAGVVTAQDSGVSTRRMMSRLLWQTWRESWWPMFLTILFAGTIGLFGIMTGLFPILYHLSDVVKFSETLFASLLMLGALYGSQVFTADQRSRRYRFLGEHAAKPRLVWLSRHIVWFGGLCVLLLVAILSIAPWLVDEYDYAVRDMERRIANSFDDWGIAFDLIQWMRVSDAAIISTTSALLGILSGYAVGQFASLLVRRSLSAGFLATLLAALMVVWGLVVHLWQLPLLLFLLPVVLGCFLATWLRIPDWLMDRNSIWSWTKPLLAVAVPSFVVLACVPGARMEQVRYLKLGAFAWLASDDEAIEPSPLDVSLSNESQELIRLGELIEHVRGYEDTPEDKELEKRRELDWKRRYTEQNKEIIRRAVELSGLPGIEVSASAEDSTIKGRLQNLAHLLLLSGDVNLNEGELSESFERYLAALRILGTIRRGETSGTIQSVLKHESDIMKQIAEWSHNPQQTSKLLLKAVEELNRIYPATEADRVAISETEKYQPPDPTVNADVSVLRDVILGKRPPAILSGDHTRLSDYLAVLANQLPFERRRAMRVLAQIAEEEHKSLDALQDRLQLSQIDDSSQDVRGNARVLREEIVQGLRRSAFYDRESDLTTPSAETSYLLAKERRARAGFPRYLEAIANSYVRQLAVKLQLALAAYRIDHGAYPKSFDKLVPNYLSSVPIDPFSGEPFNYEPAGLPLKLNVIGETTLAPETPFFWSVGANNYHLEQYRTGVFGDYVSPPAEEHDPEYEDAYRLRPDGLDWASHTTLVFPLPPIALPTAPLAQPVDEVE